MMNKTKICSNFVSNVLYLLLCQKTMIISISFQMTYKDTPFPLQSDDYPFKYPTMLFPI